MQSSKHNKRENEMAKDIAEVCPDLAAWPALEVGTPEEMEKKRRIEAAAPDLLAALEKAASMQAYRPGEGPDWWEQARAAIAKAKKGE